MMMMMMIYYRRLLMTLDYFGLLWIMAVYPIIQVHNQLVGAPLGSEITLDCLVEASPKPINYWARDTGQWRSFAY